MSAKKMGDKMKITMANKFQTSNVKSLSTKYWESDSMGMNSPTTDKRSFSMEWKWVETPIVN